MRGREGIILPHPSQLIVSVQEAVLKGMNKQMHLESTTGKTPDMAVQGDLKYDCILSFMINI